MTTRYRVHYGKSQDYFKDFSENEFEEAKQFASTMKFYGYYVSIWKYTEDNTRLVAAHDNL